MYYTGNRDFTTLYELLVALVKKKKERNSHFDLNDLDYHNSAITI